MKKFFTFILLGCLLSIGMSWAEDATFTMSSIFTGSNQSATLTSPVDAVVSTTSSASNASTGKLGSDGNYFQVVLTNRTFNSVSINGFINTTSTDKNWGLQFSTDGGNTWAAEVTQANDGNKTAHDFNISVTIPSGANGFRIIRRAGTSTNVNSITLALNSLITYTVTYKANGTGESDVVDYNAAIVAANPFTYANHIFIGWNTQADGMGTSYAVNDAVPNALSLYAQWQILCGEIIKAELNGGNTANMSGLLGGTFDSNLSSGKYKLDKNKYIGIQLSQGSFQEGDTVIVTMTTAGANYPCLFADKNRTNCLFLATAGSSALEYKIVLPAAANGLTTLYLSRGNDDGDDVAYKWNPTVSAMSVVRPMPEKSRGAVTITNATIDGEALTAAELNTLKSTHSFASVSQFANAPVVKFYTSVTVTYEDDSQNVLNDSVVVTAVENGDLWQAQAEIDAVTYTITAVHPVSFTVTYMYGETILGEEAVIAGESPANYATHQSLQLATFNGWFSDAGLSNAVTMTNAEIVQDTTFYASFTLLFAESINIEQLVLDNGTGYDLMAQMGAQYYASNLTNNLDSLNDEKSKRNEPYLGQKAKIAGSLLNFRVAADNTVKVKFGNIGKTPQVSINGGDYANMTITNGVYTYVADADALLSIKTADASTVVFKQIVIGADPQIATVVLPATSAEITLGANGWSTYAATYDFTVSGATVYKAAYDAVKNAVVLTEVENAVVPAEEGIILKGTEGDEITINSTTNAVSDFAGNKLVGTISEKTAPANAYVISTNAGVTMFNPIDPDADPAIKIPAHKAYMIIAPAQGAPSAIRIEFAENNATDIKSIMDSEKAVKFIENGKLFILKNGVVYDVTGAMVK